MKSADLCPRAAADRWEAKDPFNGSAISGRKAVGFVLPNANFLQVFSGNQFGDAAGCNLLGVGLSLLKKISIAESLYLREGDLHR